MSVGIRNFRRKLFGGFDRQDVTSYIVEAAEERNSLQREMERMSLDAENRIAELENEKDGLQSLCDTYKRELENTRSELEQTMSQCSETIRRLDEMRDGALTRASLAVEDMGAEYSDARAGLEEAVARIRQDMEQLNSALDSITGLLGESGKRIRDIERSIEGERQKLTAGESAPANRLSEPGGENNDAEFI